MRIGMADGQTVDSMSVATWVNQQQFHTGMAIHDYLTVTDGQNNLVPHLAVSWEPNDDASEWTFKLRSGVEHFNGKTVDAADVAGSWMYHINEESKSSFKAQAEIVKNVVVDDPETVVFQLHTPSADFPVLTSSYQAAIMACADGKPIDDTMGGAGPYLLQEWEPGVRAVLERNPNHWNDAVAHFDSAELNVILDDAARQNALITGEVDCIMQVNLSTVDRLAAVDGITVLQVEGRQHYTFPMRTDMGPFTDNNIRMALKHAIDREELLEKILRGRGSIGNDQPISAAYAMHDPELEQRAYDPDKAKWYLEQAGLDNLKVTLSIANAAWPGALDGAVLFGEAARAANIDIEIERVPDDGFWSNTWMVKPFSGCVWYGRLVADEALTVTYAEGASWNDTYWSHDRFNELLTEARGTLDVPLRREMYAEMQRIIRDEGGQIVPLFANWVDAISDRVGTPEHLSGVQNLDGSRAVSRWWFKS